MAALARMGLMVSFRSEMSKKSQRLRVLSYNIHQGLTIHRQKIALSILKEAIRSMDADVVLLQEVAGNEKGGRTETQLEGLADSLWPYHAYQKNAVFAGGFHGNAILSRHPIKKWKHYDLTVKPLDRRGMLHAEIFVEESGISVDIMAIHLGLLQFERRRQLTHVCNYIEKRLPLVANCVLGGDFNDWRQLVSKRLAKKVGLQEAHLSHNAKHGRTFPARFPVLKLDRIYYRGLQIRQARVLKGQPWMFLSDHLPLLAEFELPHLTEPS